MKNGVLLRAAEREGYQVFITVDRGLAHQLPGHHTLAVILISVRTNQLDELLPVAPAITAILEKILPGSTVSLPPMGPNFHPPQIPGDKIQK